MIPLPGQEYFEQLIGRAEAAQPLPGFAVIYFTAKWCGACKRLDLGSIMQNVSGAVWFKCDIDENDYTPGFCGIRSIPTFLVVKDKKIIGSLGDSRTDKVIQWLLQFV